MCGNCPRNYRCQVRVNPTLQTQHVVTNIRAFQIDTNAYCAIKLFRIFPQ
eukprot:UN08375